MSNWHGSRVWCRRRSGAASPSATGFTITGTAPARTAMSWRSSPPVNLKDGKDQSRRRPDPGSFSAFPIRDESGRVILVAEHVRDITERHLAEQALKESEGRFRTLIEDSPESLFLTDVQGTILAASRVAARRLGKNLEEVIGGHHCSIYSPRRWPPGAGRSLSKPSPPGAPSALKTPGTIFISIFTSIPSWMPTGRCPGCLFWP